MPQISVVSIPYFRKLEGALALVSDDCHTFHLGKSFCDISRGPNVPSWDRGYFLEGGGLQDFMLEGLKEVETSHVRWVVRKDGMVVLALHSFINQM